MSPGHSSVKTVLLGLYRMSWTSINGLLILSQIQYTVIRTVIHEKLTKT